MISRDEALSNGYKRYYDGMICDYGHDSERYSSTGACVICVKYYNRSNHHDEIMSRRNEATKSRQFERRKDTTFRETENAKRRVRNKNPAIRKLNRVREKTYKDSEKGRFVSNCRTQLHQTITKPKLDKLRKCDVINGYSYRDIIEHIETYMADGMTWDNYGTVWNISHRIPPSRLYDEGIRDIKIINSLLNLRPVFSNDTPKKRTKTEDEYFEMNPDIAKQYPIMPEFKYE